MDKLTRFKQRYSNLVKAFGQLTNGIVIERPSEIETQGIIQVFEFTFELAWKALKDYLESQNIVAQYPRDVVKEAFAYSLIDDGELWIDMLEKRNLLSHTYDKQRAQTAYNLIKDKYYAAISQVVSTLESKNSI